MIAYKHIGKYGEILEHEFNPSIIPKTFKSAYEHLQMSCDHCKFGGISDCKPIKINISIEVRAAYQN